MYLTNLERSLQCRFWRLGDVADLHEAITPQQQAAHFMPENHPNKPQCLGNLGISRRNRFDRLGDIADLHEAITVGRLAVNLTPNDHPDNIMSWKTRVLPPRPV